MIRIETKIKMAVGEKNEKPKSGERNETSNALQRRRRGRRAGTEQGRRFSQFVVHIHCGILL